MKWTDEKLQAQELPLGRSEVRILVAPNLYFFLRRRTSGNTSKQWQYRVQVDGTRRWLSLGAFPAVGLDNANDEMLAHQRANEAAKRGQADRPVLGARIARKAAKAQPTVSELFNQWIADKRIGSARKAGAPVRERTVQLLEGSFEADIVGRIGDIKAGRLTGEALQACIDAPRQRGAPSAAAHVYRTLRGLVNFAIAHGHIPGADPMRGIRNPKPYRPAATIAASDAEIVALLRVMDASQLWEATKLAIEFQLLTGTRPSEVRLATWSEIDLGRALWTVPAERVKSDREFRVHLCAQVIALLTRAQAIRSHTSDFVFASANGGALEKMAVARALARLTERFMEVGGRKLRPHDLRRTFRTLLSRIQVPRHVAELCMNHQDTQTRRRGHDGHDYSAEMAEAWNRVGAHIAVLHQGVKPVTSLMRQRSP